MQEYKLLNIISEIKQAISPKSVLNLEEFDKIKDPLPGETFLKWLRRNDMPPIWAEKRKGRNGNSYFSTKINFDKFIDDQKLQEYLEIFPNGGTKVSSAVALELQSYFDRVFGIGRFKVIVTNNYRLFRYIPNIRIYTQERPKHNKMMP